MFIFQYIGCICRGVQTEEELQYFTIAVAILPINQILPTKKACDIYSIMYQGDLRKEK